MLITIRYMIIPINTTYISISILVHFFYFVVLGSDRMKLGEPELKTLKYSHVTGLQLPCDMGARIDGARCHLARYP